ncbi:hypothetical protein FSP39_015781, partial [Pinctada imbricata]
QPHTRPHCVAQPSRLKSTQIYSQSVCSNIPTSSDRYQHSLVNPDRYQHSLVNPDHNFVDSDKSYITRKERVLKSDIHTLFKISSNTSASKKLVRKPRMADGNIDKPEDGQGNGQAFETVAEALHLQWSVIGNISSNSTLPHVSMATDDVMETNRQSSQHSAILPGSASVPSQVHSVPLPGHSSAGAHSLKPSVNGKEKTIVRMPTEITSAGSFKSQSPSSALQSYATTSADAKNIRIESDSGGLSDTEKFLRSLPPQKTINISDILPQTHVRSHSPPVKETSFKPIPGGAIGQLPGTITTSPLSANIDRNPVMQSSSSEMYVQQSSASVVDSGIGIDVECTPVSSEKHKVTILTSTPKKSPSDLMPDLSSSVLPLQTTTSGPLFNGIQQPNFGATQRLNEILQEKAKLEGRLEMLTHEARVSIQERSELQAQIVALKQKLKTRRENEVDEEKQNLKAELERLRSNRNIMEQSVASAQSFLEEKILEAKILQEDLQVTQDTNDKLQIRMKELRDDIRAKEMTIQALKNKIAELYVEVQAVMQSKMESDNEARGARSDLTSLVNAKLWYQQQLQAANEVKSALQLELTSLQSQVTSQGSVIERLKTENTKIRHQLKDTQQKAIKDKETLAKHLEMIESDMMERESAFQEIQRERTMIEGTFDLKLETVEQERIRLQSLYHVTNDLENQLDRAQNDLKKKQSQIFALENEQIDLMKKLTLSQETVIDKERVIEELQQKLIGVEEELRAFQGRMGNLDSEIWKLKEEKAATEISLKAALEEKSSVDSALENLKNDMGKVEKSFRHMKQELSNKSIDLNKVAAEKTELQTEVEKLTNAIKEARKVDEKGEKEMDKKEQILSELQLQKVKLETEVSDLKNLVLSLETSKQEYEQEKVNLISNIKILEGNLIQSTNELQQAKHEVETYQESSQTVTDKSHDLELANENLELKQKIEDIEDQHEEDKQKHRTEVDKLNSDVGTLQNELTDRQSTYETNLELLSSRLREVSGDKARLQTEIDSLQRKFDVNMLEKQDSMKLELQGLVSEIEELKLEKQFLEKKLFEVQRSKEEEVGELHQRLAVLDDEILSLRTQQSDTTQIEELNYTLSLELAKEKGKVEGLLQTNSSLKDHISVMETSSADMETTLSDLQTKVAIVTKEKEEVELECTKKIQDLEDAQKENDKSQRDLRKQIGTKITENKKLKRQVDTLKQERESIQQELQIKTEETQAIKDDLQSQTQICKGQTTALSTLDGENKDLRRELERLKEQLADNLARESIIQGQIQSLEWQLSQKGQEVESVQAMMKSVEQRQNMEMENLHKTIQESQEELEDLRSQLATLRQEKASQHAQASELRTTLKASIQHHKLTERINKMTRDAGTQVEVGDITIPPLPFDLEEVEKMIQNSSVKAMESKPLDNLQSCLTALRSEISGLQKQMDVHATTLQSTTQSWNSVQGDVMRLKEAMRNGGASSPETMATVSIAAASVDLENSESSIINI